MESKRTSLRNTIILSFIITITSIISLIGFVAFSQWKTSINAIIMQNQRESNKNIKDKLDAFLKAPIYINDFGYNMIVNGLVNIYDQNQREVFFAGIMKASPEYVYSFSFGTKNGEYYGARRNSTNQIELMKSDGDTNGNSMYYTTTTTLNLGEFVGNFGKFDPRTRDWYNIAKEKEKPIFSPIYQHFILNDLAITASYPMYDKAGVFSGVLGTHLPVSNLNTYLKEIVEENSAVAYIVEKKTGMLVANSLDKPNFTTVNNNELKRISIEEIENSYIKKAYQNYRINLKNIFISNTKKDRLHISINDYQKEGIEWLIITAIPESKFTNIIGRSIHTCISLSVILLVIGIAIWAKKTEHFLIPINNLIITTEKFSKGDLSQRTSIVRDDEIGRLSSAFDEMADKLCSLIQSLENKKGTLEKVNSSMKAAKEEAEKANEAKSLFIANISHELRTPLNVILGAIQLMKMVPIEPRELSYENPYNKYIGVMQQNCFRLVRLINNLIDITKIDASFLDINLKNSNIVSVIEDITLSVVQYVESRNISIVFDTEVEERILAIDLDKIERIMLNLLSNAIKYSKPDGIITVNIYDKEESVIISVKDTGVGIPEDMIDRIFERFSRVDDSLNRMVEGSGIGLSLVKALIEAHGGTISVSSLVGIGTEFIIELPVRIIDEQKDTREKPVIYQTNIERIKIEFSDIYS
jgi:signal transduction histidine kinase